jgi:hypothetical protein
MPIRLRGLVVASVLLPAPLAAAAPPNGAGPAPDGALDRQTRYERVVSLHFDLPEGEARLLLEEGIQLEELPVVLLLARERGVSPSVVISRRTRSDPSTTWLQVAAQMDLGAGVFHVELGEEDLDRSTRRSAELFRSTPRERWDALALTDDEVITLANVRVLSRSLGVPEGRVLHARGEAGSWVGAVDLLVGEAARPGGGRRE